MADNSVAGFGKDPLATSHGDTLADQSFQSLKSKEVRDSLSPTEMKFQSMTLNNPNTTGWNVQSFKEVSPDGRGFRAETIATTDGVENVNGGIAEFKGRNEQRSSAHHQGDDKNFVKKAMESSNSHLQEKVVIGDENSGRTEVRTSSSTSTSSSQVFQSSTNVEYEDGVPIQQAQPQKYLMDSNRHYQQDLQQRQLQEEQRLREEQRRYEQQFQQQRQQHLNQQERRTSEQSTTTRQNTEQKNISQNVQTQETHEQNKRYVDMDKASPEYQQHVQYLMQQPGEIISNTVEYPKPNVKMITTVKRLPDGTIVRNKRYETEEVAPTSAPSSNRPASSAPNQTQIRRDSQQQQPNYQPEVAPHSSQRPSEDMVDSGTTTRYVHDSLTDDVETKFSSVKKSSRKFSTETTSETIQEFDEHQPHGEPFARPKSVTNDFTTHGFPSVRANKPTQEYPTDRPRPTQGYPSQAAPKPNEAVVPYYTDAVDNISERRIPTKDGEVIIVSSEKKSNFKTQSNSERIVETERIVRDDQQDFTTHGFPSVREPVQQPKMYPSERQIQPHEQDFPLDKFSPGARIIKPNQVPYQQGDDETVVVNSQKSHTTKYNTNTERVIEHEIIRDDQGYPIRTPVNADNLPYTVSTPGDQVPHGEFPGSPRKPANADFSTHGFPSVRTPSKGSPGDYTPQGDYAGSPRKSPESDFSTQGFPSVRTPSKGSPGNYTPQGDYPGSPRKSPENDFSTQGFPSVRTPSKGSPGDYTPQRDYPGSPRKTPESDFSTQGFPSVKTPSQPAAGYSAPKGEYFSTHGFPSIRSPTKTTPTQGHPTNGTATPSSKTQPRSPSPNKYKTPTGTTKETTERVIRKEKEVDSAHRAFAASLRSSSPIDHVRRDSSTTDSHSRHTPRSSVSSTKTFRRDMREGSHDSAPSETSRISTTTITRNTPPRTVGGRTVVTRVVTTKTGQGSNDSLNVTSPRATKSPSPGKTVTTTTTTTTRTLNKTPTPTRDVPKSTDTPTTSTTTTSIPINESLLQYKSKLQPLTTITKIKLSENHKLQQLHPTNKPKTTTTDKKSSKRKANTKVSSSPTSPLTPNAEAVLKEIIEKPCIKKHYYKLGPSDTLPIVKQNASAIITNTANATTSQPYKLSQTNGKIR